MFWKMLKKIRGESVEDLWQKSAEDRRRFTPDLNWLTTKQTHLLFVYDAMKRGFPDNGMLGNAKLICNGMTRRDDYAMWLKPEGKDIKVLAATTTVDPSDRFEYPGNPWPGNIKGQLFLVPTEDLFDVDEMVGNGVYFQRKRIDILPPWQNVHWVKNETGWVPSDQPEPVRAYAYHAKANYVASERNGMVPARRFNPGRRDFNQRDTGIIRYYEYTRMDLNDL